MDPRALLPKGEHRAGDKPCARCKDLFLNPTSRDAILHSPPAYLYCWCYNELRATAKAGCILCFLLLNHHQPLGPSTDPTAIYDTDIDHEAGCDCELVFEIQRLAEEADPGDELRSLVVKGPGRDGPFNFALYLQTPHDDPAALFVPVRPIELDDASAQCFSSARKWLADCSANHPDCETNSQPPLPTRVIDVSESDDVLKLHQSGPEDKGAYAALSYCWGSEQPEQTTTANLNRYLAGFRCSDLAQSLQDAISITRQLGIQRRYQEIVQMRAIYENATVTVAAAVASSVRDGFLHPRNELTFSLSMFGYGTKDYYTSFKLPFRCPGGARGHVTVRGDIYIHNVSDPICKRAWTLQESLLSPRLLIYSTTQLLWRCRTVCETMGGFLTWYHFKRAFPVLELSSPAPIETLGTAARHPPIFEMYYFGNDVYNLQDIGPQHEWYSDSARRLLVSDIEIKWMEVVGQFTSRKLSNDTDKMPALAGIAEKFQIASGFEYCAGLWRQGMLAGLSWRRNLYASSTRNNTTIFDEGPLKWRAPSWSWASVEGPVSYETHNAHWSSMQKHAHVHDVFVDHLPGHAPFGQLWWGEVTIEGWLRRVAIEDITDGDWPNRLGRRADLRFADVFLREPAGAGAPDVDGAPRCGTALLDDSIEAVPYHWSHPHGMTEVFCLTLFSSSRWTSNNRRHRTHGLLLTKYPIGDYLRIGWFDSLACNAEEFNCWFKDVKPTIIKLQ